MTSGLEPDRLLAAHFRATADPTVMDGQVDAIAAATTGRRQLPAWLAAMRSPTMSTTARSFGRPVPATVWAMLLLLTLLLVLIGAAVSTGTWQPIPAAPIVNGPIVFGRYSLALDDTELYLMRPDGTGEHRLLAGAHECPTISPDGRRVAFAGGVVDIDGSGLRQFTQPVAGLTLGCSAWSPDGRRLAAEGFNDADKSRNGIFLINSTDGGDPVRLTTHGEGANDVPGHWSPDGRSIAYIHAAVGNGNGTLWVLDTTNGSRRQVVPDTVDLGPSWSADGQWIAVHKTGNLFLVVHPDGTGAHDVPVPASVENLSSPAFSPDGTRLAFEMQVSGAGQPDVYTMKLDGTDLVQVTNTLASEAFIDWGVDPR